MSSELERARELLAVELDKADRRHIQTAKEEGRAEERKAIIEFLRAQADCADPDEGYHDQWAEALNEAAFAIASGEHLPLSGEG